MSKILNPETGRMVSINSKLGRKIKAEEELHVFVDAIIPVGKVPKVEEVVKVVNDVIEVIDVNDADVEKFENVVNSLNSAESKSIDKKTYMKEYYQKNKNKIKDRSKDRYALKKEINGFVDKINESILN
jgi:hypothetical protein